MMVGKHKQWWVSNSRGVQTKVVYCGKNVFTSRISGPDKYQQVVLGVQRGVYGPMVRVLEPFGMEVCNVR